MKSWFLPAEGSISRISQTDRSPFSYTEGVKGGSEPATKSDIAAIGLKVDTLEQKFDALDRKVDTLEQKFDALERKVDALDLKVDAFGRNLEDFKVEVNTRFLQFESRIESMFHEMEGRIVTSMYRIAESMNARVTEQENESAVLKKRMALLETRVLEVEKRLDIPPVA
jgi:chromosome segregation ATPase